jgi:hypothetical protein
MNTHEHTPIVDTEAEFSHGPYGPIKEERTAWKCSDPHCDAAWALRVGDIPLKGRNW